MSRERVKAVIVGCGNIASTYARQMSTYDSVELVGFSDLEQERAETFAGEHGGTAYASLDDALSDPDVDLIVNLTIHHVHFDISRQCLEAGKHVHTEKPLALSSTDAHALVDLAEKQ